MKTLDQRFWEKVKKTRKCWLWTAGVNASGYGKFGVQYKTRIAPRVSWELANGPIPDGLFVLHKCDVPACVRPSHLFLGTQTENLLDMTRKGRRRYRSHSGSDNGMAILNEIQVSEIRMWSLIGLNRAEIARWYGMAWTSISDIVLGQSWKLANDTADERLRKQKGENEDIR